MNLASALPVRKGPINRNGDLIGEITPQHGRSARADGGRNEVNPLAGVAP